jgi:nicotinamide riboside kinase
VAIVGAESTGKSTLALSLAQRIADDTGLTCAPVDEYLRTWCEQAGRTPRIEEQRGIAQRQQQRIEAAAASHDVVVADTTAAMIAVYSRFVFGDRSLDAWAAAEHTRSVQHTLVTALDLPWVADGLQREGEHVRAPIDAMLREMLAAHGIGWSLVSGSGTERVDNALDAVTPLLARHAVRDSGLFTRLAQRDAAQPAWRTGTWVCEKCDVPDCEHRLRQTLGAEKPRLR